MSEFTVVHAADVHLDTIFPETSGGARRRRALADAFVRIVDLALERRADVLTLGGDLYEADRAGPQTVRFLFEQFARFGRPIFIAPGNHDPHAPNALLARTDLPENVRIFNEATWRAFPLREGITLFGFGHTPAEPGRPFAGARFERDGVRIALVHGSDEARCPPHKRATAPFTASEIVAAGATVLLTGHYHGGYVHEHDGRQLFGYPGSPEPIKFGESPVHGALVATIAAGRVSLEAVPIARTRLVERRCDVTGAGTQEAIAAGVEAALAGLGADDYVRLRLGGAVASGTHVDAAALRERCSAGLGSLAIDDRTVAYDYAAIAREPTVRGHVVRDLLSRSASDADGTLAAAALRYALAAFEGGEIAP